ncbi:hypothetical protein [Ornithinibacillus contaminans]|uniref:hypothetical protein n=1 Tax=Ornithinibacillus contaminans TaxID=694055 RepID=UPI00064DEA24|nr:hypothetical protein [Ornithinibacillus contaminans]
MKTRIYEREKLYKEVWEEPMTSLSKRYNISDVALRKQCKKMGIPLPKAGHWAKVKAGHKIKIPPLPKMDVPSKVVVKAPSGDLFGRKMDAVLLFLPEDERKRVKEYCFSLKVPSKLVKPHVLITDTKQYYRSRKELTRPPMNRVINMKVSEEQKERTYRFYSTLFKGLEHMGYTIEVKEPKYPGYYKRNELFISLNEDSVPIFIKEKQRRIEHNPTEQEKDSYRSSYDYIMTGKLHFGIDAYHAKRKNWNDTETKKIEDQIGEIIIWVMETIHVEKVIREKREAEKVRRLEEERVRQQIAERKEAELKRLELLNQHAIDWDKADQIRRFANAVEMKLKVIDKVEEKNNVIHWIKWARDKADWIDPLINKDDDVLGKGSWYVDLIPEDE